MEKFTNRCNKLCFLLHLFVAEGIFAPNRKRMEEKKDTPQRLYCQFCGKRLPVDILHSDGKVRLLVVCAHCKGKNIVEKDNIR